MVWEVNNEANWEEQAPSPSMENGLECRHYLSIWTLGIIFVTCLSPRASLTHYTLSSREGWHYCLSPRASLTHYTLSSREGWHYCLSPRASLTHSTLSSREGWHYLQHLELPSLIPNCLLEKAGAASVVQSHD